MVISIDMPPTFHSHARWPAVPPLTDAFWRSRTHIRPAISPCNVHPPSVCLQASHATFLLVDAMIPRLIIVPLCLASVATARRSTSETVHLENLDTRQAHDVMTLEQNADGSMPYFDYEKLHLTSDEAIREKLSRTSGSVLAVTIPTVRPARYE